MWGPTQNLRPIGSSVLTFIGYNRIATQTDPRQTSKLYRSRFLGRFAPIFYSIANSFDHSFTFQGSCEVPHKIRARSVQPFWRVLNIIQIDTQTSKDTNLSGFNCLKVDLRGEYKYFEMTPPPVIKKVDFSFLFHSVRCVPNK